MLFLDELTEFRRDALEGLRQPLEDGRVVVTRVIGSVEYPARFTLVAAANPCPCGYDGDVSRRCTCRIDRVEVYRSKLSGPLLDRVAECGRWRNRPDGPGRPSGRLSCKDASSVQGAGSRDAHAAFVRDGVTAAGTGGRRGVSAA